MVAYTYPLGIVLAVHGQQFPGDPDEAPSVVEELRRPAVGIELLGQLAQAPVGALGHPSLYGHGSEVTRLTHQRGADTVAATMARSANGGNGPASDSGARPAMTLPDELDPAHRSGVSPSAFDSRIASWSGPVPEPASEIPQRGPLATPIFFRELPTTPAPRWR